MPAQINVRRHAGRDPSLRLVPCAHGRRVGGGEVLQGGEDVICPPLALGLVALLEQLGVVVIELGPHRQTARATLLEEFVMHSRAILKGLVKARAKPEHGVLQTEMGDEIGGAGGVRSGTVQQRGWSTTHR